MTATAAKQVMFVYNGNEATAEVELDTDGTFPEPPDGSILKRNGKQWKVARSRVQSESAEPRLVPLLRIDLTDRF